MSSKKNYITILFLISMTCHSLGQCSLNSNRILNIPTTTSTGEKPQSKVWEHQGYWWAVFPTISGTHLWKLDTTNLVWIKVKTISNNTASKADCKKVDGTTHILLFQGINSELISLRYNSNDATYDFLNPNITSTPICFNEYTEIASIDIDGNGVMWIAYDGINDIFVKSSPYPYFIWNPETSIASGIKEDDICVVTSMSNKVGVLWSNQNEKEFGFRTHLDGEPQSSWSVIERPPSSYANVGEGLADDHLNIAVTNDGTIYCAVKTGYDSDSFPKIAMLVRNPNGNWEDLYYVDNVGTRPIVVIDEENNKLQIIYTEIERGGNIVCKETNLTPISFGKRAILIEATEVSKYNNVSSTKDNYVCEVVILTSTQNNSDVDGTLARCP